MVRAFNNSPQGPRKAPTGPAVTVSSPLLNLDKMSMGSRLKGWAALICLLPVFGFKSEKTGLFL